MPAKKKIQLRTIIQLFFFILIGAIAVSHTASLHALCPFGGVVSIQQFISSGTFVKKIHESSFILMIIVFILTLLFGPVFCGWVCPFGTFQEWMGRIGKRIFKSKYNRFIPYKYDKYLRFLRYGILAWVLYATTATGKIVFSDVDPYYALFNFWSSEVVLSGLIVLGIVMAASLFVERPWCKYACPYGAVLGVFNLFRIFPIRRGSKTCISCKACDRVCPMNIEVSGKDSIRDHQCISCMRCTSEEGCPISDTVYMAARGGKIA